jgi:hypothetical protein
MTLLRNTLLVFSILTLGSIARADAIITGSTASGDTFSIDATTTPYAPGIVSITGATGTVIVGGVSNTITGIEAPSAPGVVTYSDSGYFIFNDLLYAPPATPFDYYGALFTLSNGSDVELNLFYNNSGDPTSGVYYDNSGFNSPIASISVTYTSQLDIPNVIPVNVAPEPSSIVLLGTGLLASAFILRKKLVPAVAETGTLA